MSLLQTFFNFSKHDLSCAGQTDRGKLRKRNEDGYSIMPNRNIFLVSDGMGGHNAGEVASRVALESMASFFTKNKSGLLDGNQQYISRTLIGGFVHANETVMRMAEEHTAYQGMGCTMVACHISHSQLHICHVGDARCYVAGKQVLKQLTTDHTYSAEQKKAGIFASQDTAGASRNAVTRAIGFPFPEEPEYHVHNLRPGERILLCSDGLWSMVNPARIHQTLIGLDSPENVCKTLVRMANDAGGKDNITAVVVFC